MTLGAVKAGDIVLADRKGRRFFAVVTARRERGLERAGGTAGADHAGPGRGDPGKDLLVGVEAEHASAAEDEGVHGLAFRLVARCNDTLLVRDGDVRSGEAESHERPDRGDGILDVERGVVPRQARVGEGRVLHQG